MSIIKNGFCTKLTSEFDKRMSTLSGVSGQLTNKLTAATSFLSTFRASERSLISNLQGKISSATNLVPNLSQFDELIDLANMCLFTKNDPMLSKPSTIARGLTSALKSNAFNAMNDLAKIGDSVIPEFNAAKLLSELKSQISVSGVGKMAPEATQLLNCMSAICGTDITSRLNSLTSFLSTFNINADGELDVSALLDSQGISGDGLDQINDCCDMVDGVMDNIESSVSDGIDRLNDLFSSEDD